MAIAEGVRGGGGGGVGVEKGEKVARVQRKALYERRSSNNNDKEERRVLTNENASESVFGKSAGNCSGRLFRFSLSFFTSFLVATRLLMILSSIPTYSLAATSRSRSRCSPFPCTHIYPRFSFYIFDIGPTLSPSNLLALPNWPGAPLCAADSIPPSIKASVRRQSHRHLMRNLFCGLDQVKISG